MLVARRATQKLAGRVLQCTCARRYEPNSTSGVEKHTLAGYMTARGTVVGTGDRAAGLQYRDPPPASRQSEIPENLESPFLLKVQAPLDNSSDAAGGIGKTMPTTLLLYDRDGAIVRYVGEEETGHNALLRCALSQRSQIAYLYGALESPSLATKLLSSSPTQLRIFTEMLPEAIGERF